MALAFQHSLLGFWQLHYAAHNWEITMQGFQRTTALLLLLSAGWAYAQADEKPSFAAQAQIAVDDQQ